MKKTSILMNLLFFVSFNVAAKSITLKTTEGLDHAEVMAVTLDDKTQMLTIEISSTATGKIVLKSKVKPTIATLYPTTENENEIKLYSTLVARYYNTENIVVKFYLNKDKSDASHLSVMVINSNRF